MVLGNSLKNTGHNLNECTNKINKFKNKIRYYQKSIFAKNKQICELKKQLINKQKCQVIFNNSLKNKTDEYEKKAWRFKEEEKSFALSLHYNSPKGYLFMRKYLCLPTIRSLRRWLHCLNFSCGLNDNILEIMKNKFTLSTLSEKAVSIIFDEMSIKRFVTYNSQNDVFSGFEDFGAIIEIKNNLLCDQALVIMVKGIKQPWKQVVGYFFSKGPISGLKLKTIIMTTIKKLKSIDLIPKVIICEQGTNNQKLRNLLKITIDEPFLTFEDEKIYFMYDTPHLIKSVRNNLKKYDFIYKNEVYSWSDIIQFYNIDKNKVPRLAPKLKDQHIQLPPFSPMRVCLATQTFSHTVSSALFTLIANNLMNSTALHTAKFVKIIDDLFDVFNSCSFDEPKIFREPLTNNSKHWIFLNESYEILTKLEIQNAKKNSHRVLVAFFQIIIV